MNLPLVSVIIPNFNNEIRLQLCLQALMEQSYPRHLTEIIVIDNGSEDNSVIITQKFPVKLLVEKAFQSPYWCRNAGIKASTGEIIVLLDSNCVPVATWLKEGVKCFQALQSGILMGPVHFIFSSAWTIAERLDYLYSVYTPEDIRNSSGLPGGHLFIARQIFDQIGYFIPHIRSRGDMEWTQRAKKHGYSFDFCPNAIVNYPAKTLNKAMKKMVRLGGGKKELWIFEGRSKYHPLWILQILKNFLPPSPAFYREMAQRNRDEQTQIPPISLYLGLYLIKLCYAWGMLFKKLPRPVSKTENE